MRSKKRRATGTIDKLQPQLKDTVDQMLLAGGTYREICQYLAEHEVKLTQSSVSRYARRFLTSANELRIAQENFRMILTETERYPNLDPAEAILRLASQKAFDALSLVDDGSWADTDPDKIIANATALARAVAYKRKIDTDVKSDTELALESNQALLYDNLKRDNPKLYDQLYEYIKQQKAKELCADE
jgi:hypothetical protein